MSPTPWFRRHGQFRISNRGIGRWTVLEVSGKFTAGPPETDFQNAIDRALASGTRRIVVDLTAATLVDDAIAAAAPAAYHKVIMAGGVMKFVVLPGKAGGYYHMAGLELTLPTFTRLGGAIEL